MAKLRGKIFFTVSLTAFSVASLILTIFNNNPFSSDSSVFILFYSSFFCSTLGLSVLIILFLKSRFKESIANSIFWPTARLSFLIASVATLLLILKGLNILDLWVGIPLTLAILMLELFFRGNKYRKPNEI